MATVKDIASEAGVSPMTVSNVINNRPNVRATTRSRVIAAMDKLDYRVNVAARSLRTGRTHTIGLAIPEVDAPYYGEFGAAVIAHGARHDVQVVIEQTGRSRDNELNAIALSRLRMYDGLILSTVGLGARDAHLLRVDFPVVILGERIFHGPLDHVAMPNVSGAEAAVDHLIEKGSRRILILQGYSSDDPDVSSLRHEGYERSLSRHGIAIDPDLTRELAALTPEAAAASISEALRDGLTFDGVFCVTDYVALGALRALTEHQIQVPGQVKVIGFDDLHISTFLTPSLSSINPDHDLMARTAVDLLMRRINENVTEATEFVSPYTVVERESSQSS